MKATEATIGQKETCQMCGVEITCGQTQASEKYPAKNQWQVDGKAHYNYDFKTKTTTCNTSQEVIEDPKNKSQTRFAIEPPLPAPRNLSFEDFQRQYRDLWSKASEITTDITNGKAVTETEKIQITQRILKSFFR